MSSEPRDDDGPVIRDKRRIDPETGEVREQAGRPAPLPSGSDIDDEDESTPALSDAELALAERTADLQRVQAEYVNYKRRVDRDREVARQGAIASVLTALLPVLDDIERARGHDELTGGFKAVADSLERTVAGLGLITFGEAGDAFDPRIHEALMHSYADDVEGPECGEVLQVGYRFGERIIRPARVAVVEPPAATSVDGGDAPDGMDDVESEPSAESEPSVVDEPAG